MATSVLDIWWDRKVTQMRADLNPTRPLPSDGASWVCYVNFFGTVGLADPQIKVEYVNPVPVMMKCLELWTKAKEEAKAAKALEAWKDVQVTEVQDGK